MSSFDIAKIADALSRAAIGNLSWTSAAETVAHCTRAKGAVLLPVVGNVPLVCATDSMQHSLERYIDERWIDRDERYNGFSKFMNCGVVTDDDCLPKELRKQSAYYQDFIAGCGLRDFAGVRIGRQNHTWNLSLQRSVKQEPFQTEELQTLAQLSPQLDSVIEISVALGLARGVAALDAFQSSERAAILLDRSGKLVRANFAAEALIRTDFSLADGRLQCVLRDDTVKLEKLIGTLLWDRVACTMAPVAIRKRNGGKLVVYPMRIEGLSDSPISAFYAILVISDLEARLSPLNSTWQTVFELTPAEARVATAIANGKDPGSYAAEAKVSRETVRNHLKRIFDKTRTSSQSQLAALAALLMPKR